MDEEYTIERARYDLRCKRLAMLLAYVFMPPENTYDIMMFPVKVLHDDRFFWHNRDKMRSVFKVIRRKYKI